MRIMLNELKLELDSYKNIEKAKLLQRFFKTGKGEYGEGDIFLGITVPEQRKIALNYSALDLISIKNLLSSKIHEYRLVALLILAEKFKRADNKTRKEIFEFYLNNTKYINNWDLVDLSADRILGNYLRDKNKDILYNLIRSENLWERRISIVSTFCFIKNNEFEDSLKILEMTLGDKHDLIHKAAGWMLREIGKRDKNLHKEFLEKFYKKMPRTMLRYAIERLGEKERDYYMQRER